MPGPGTYRPHLAGVRPNAPGACESCWIRAFRKSENISRRRKFHTYIYRIAVVFLLMLLICFCFLLLRLNHSFVSVFLLASTHDPGIDLAAMPPRVSAAAELHATDGPEPGQYAVSGTPAVTASCRHIIRHPPIEPTHDNQPFDFLSATDEEHDGVLLSSISKKQNNTFCSQIMVAIRVLNS